MKMKFLSNKISRIIIVAVVVSTLIASAVLITLYVQNNRVFRDLEVEFIPETMKSCPNHTAWFLVSVSYNGDDSDVIYTPTIETNTTVQTEYKFWNTNTSPNILEVFLYPTVTQMNQNIEVNVTIQADDLVASDVALMKVLNWTLYEEPIVETMKDAFVAFLALNCPSLQIDENTNWQGFWSGIQIIIVQHYLFKSNNWEMELSWHAMIPPYDWVKIYLRKRCEVAPSLAFTIDSWSNASHVIVEIEPPNQIYR